MRASAHKAIMRRQANSGLPLTCDIDGAQGSLSADVTRPTVASSKENAALLGKRAKTGLLTEFFTLDAAILALAVPICKQNYTILRDKLRRQARVSRFKGHFL